MLTIMPLIQIVWVLFSILEGSLYFQVRPGVWVPAALRDCAWAQLPAPGRRRGAGV